MLEEKIADNEAFKMQGALKSSQLQGVLKNSLYVSSDSEDSDTDFNRTEDDKTDSQNNDSGLLPKKYLDQLNLYESEPDNDFLVCIIKFFKIDSVF